MSDGDIQGMRSVGGSQHNMCEGWKDGKPYYLLWEEDVMAIDEAGR